MDEENKIDLFDPGTLVFFIMAFFADLSLLGLIGLAIPGVGLAIAMFVLLAHWGIGLIILFYFWGKAHGWLPKAILLFFWILPLPLTVGLILVVVASTKIGAFVIEQAVIQGVAIGTAGAGEALEAGAVAAEGAEVAATAAEGAEAAGAVAEGAEAAGGVAEAGSTAAEAGAEGAETGAQATTEGTEAGQAGEEVDLESPEEKNPMENLEKELNQPSEEEFHEGEGSGQEKEPDQEEPEEEPEKKNKAVENVKKVFDIMDRTNQPQQEEEESEDEDDQELPMAA